MLAFLLKDVNSCTHWQTHRHTWKETQTHNMGIYQK